MRWLVESGRPLAVQRGFFEMYVYPGAIPFCVAIQNATSAVFYKPVAVFTLAFLDVEKAAFEMADADLPASN